MVVNPSVPAKTVPDFIAYAKAHPRKINMASSGTGTGPFVGTDRWPVALTNRELEAIKDT